MQTQLLRKMDFLTGKIQWRKRRDFKGTKSSHSHMEAVARYLTAPATVIGDIGDLLSERHALERSMNRTILLSILCNIRYLAQQALPIRGDWNTETMLEFSPAAESTGSRKSRDH